MRPRATDERSDSADWRLQSNKLNNRFISGPPFSLSPSLGRRFVRQTTAPWNKRRCAVEPHRSRSNAKVSRKLCSLSLSLQGAAPALVLSKSKEAHGRREIDSVNGPLVFVRVRLLRAGPPVFCATVTQKLPDFQGENPRAAGRAQAHTGRACARNLGQPSLCHPKRGPREPQFQRTFANSLLSRQPSAMFDPNQSATMHKMYQQHTGGSQ